MQWIVIVEGLSGMYHYYGPFDTEQAARAWRESVITHIDTMYVQIRLLNSV